MTTMAMAPLNNIFETIKNLFAPTPEVQRYGHAHFVVDEAGEYRHVATEFTAKPAKNESEEGFLARVKREYREPGDAIEFRCEAGRTVTAHITRRPRS